MSVDLALCEELELSVSRRCNARGVSKNFELKRTRKGAVLLGFCRFWTTNFENSFLDVLSPKSGQKGVFTPNSCKSLNGKIVNKYVNIDV